MNEPVARTIPGETDGTLRRWGADPLDTEISEADLTAGPPCTQEEAEVLTDRARNGLREFDSAMGEIVWRQAWKALGYGSARDYLLAELGSAVDGSKKKYSRRHILRLVRALEFISALQERIGEAAKDVTVTERALRGIPDHVAGEGFTNLIGEIVEKAGDDPSPDFTQEVVDEVIAQHREDQANPSELEAKEEPSAAQDEHARPGAADDLQESTDDDEERQPARDANAERAEAMARSVRFTEFAKAWRQLANLLPHLASDLNAATDQELRELSDLGEQVKEAAALIRTTREQRDSELLESKD